MLRRWTLVLLTPTVMALSGPTPAADSDPASASATPPSEVRVAVGDLEGIDEVTVTAAAHLPDVDGVLGDARVCVSAVRTETRDEVRDGATVVVSTRRSERGCVGAPTTYRFDPLTWIAEASAEIRTEVWTTVREDGPEGTRVLDQRSEPASASVDLRWEGVGDDEVTPWVRQPQLCYVMPPVCGYGAGVAVSRAAEVAGDVHLRGLGVELPAMSGHEGVMRWWAGR